MSYLLDFKEFNEGYVTFEGGANGGRITGKGTIKTNNTDFEDVYFVKELKFNLFSVSQMCDRKNNVLFTDTKCLVLSPNFKLPDESQILLKVPRKNNMYSVDMKNIVPKESLTCLFVKATLDESMLWHRRLGHINFKNIIKLVKDKLVRGIRREFSVARTPQRNGVAERRNRTLIEAARTMALVVMPHNKTSYELFRGKLPALSFMRPFECHVTILNTLDHLGKFDRKADEGYFIRYSLNSKAFRVHKIVLVQVNLGWRQDLHKTIFMPLRKEGAPLFDSSPKIYVDDGSPLSGDARMKHYEVSNKESRASNELNYAFENLNTEYPDDLKMPSLETIVTYDDSEGEADFTNLESSIHVSPTLTIITHKNHPLKQMDVKSAFLYEMIKEEVYVCQPLGFKDRDHPDKVYKVVKSLYGLHQVPRTWYETLAKYRLGNGFHRGKIDQTLFIKRKKGDYFLVQVYVDDIIFGSSKKELYVKYVSTLVDMEKTLVKDANGNDVDVYLYRSMIRSLMYLTASRADIIFISWQCKKQTVVATYTTEAEYVAAASCCRQVKQSSIVRFGEMIQYNLTSSLVIHKRCKKIKDILTVDALST
nr:ribonuclease H-like domain-containing protein [Tanacetum cinerariifolium]